MMRLQPFTSELEEYVRDESRRSGRADGLVFATDEAEVRAALAVAAEQGLPVTVQGARTGVTAGAVPEDGLILNLSRMERIGEVRGHSVTIQPGVLLAELREVVAVEGLFFPPDPTETSASIGGMLACNASGALSFHYGSIRRWVRALRVMLADGEVLRLERGMRARGLQFELKTESGRHVAGELPELAMPSVKSAAGYFIQPDMDLLDLFIGMEGTLGVILEAELELIPAPQVQKALCVFLPDEANALRLVRFLRGEEGCLPVSPVAIEFFDYQALELLRRARTEVPAFAELPELPICFHTALGIEFHGADETLIEAAVLSVAERVEALGGSADEVWMADQPTELETLKQFRHAVPEAVNLLIDQRRKGCPGLTKLGTDMAVPDDRLEAVMRLYRDGLDAAKLEHVIFGHIGNNHVHVNILPHSLEELERGRALYLEWARAVVAMGGSVSAEHGIGKIKVPLLKEMFGVAGLDAMRRVKALFDPDAHLNPGNLFN
jgi:D-lactate dehydrogenase (cytochrome)